MRLIVGAAAPSRGRAAVLVVGLSGLLAVAGFGCAADARAGWGRPHRVFAQQIAQLAFDPQGRPWVALSATQLPSGLQASPIRVARLTGHFRLEQTRTVPVLAPGFSRPRQLAINGHGDGALLIDYQTDFESKAPAVAVAVAGWGRGQRVHAPIVLARDRFRGPIMALGRSGLCVVAWVNFGNVLFPEEETRVQIARLRRGRVLGVQTIAVPGAGEVNNLDVVASSEGGFRAAWTRREPFTPESRFTVIGTEEAVAGPGGHFGHPVATPWPAVGSLSTSEGHLTVDPRGRELALWSVGSLLRRESALYVSSRLPGHPFSSPQRLGPDAFAEVSTASTIDRHGRITVVWTARPHEALLVASGQVGHRLRVRTLVGQRRVAGPFEDDPLVTTTSDGEALAVWTESNEEVSGDVVVAASSTDGFNFTAPRRISRPTNATPRCTTDFDSLLAAGLHGPALAVWACPRRSEGSVQQAAHYWP